jgi:hypothetical protein
VWLMMLQLRISTHRPRVIMSLAGRCITGCSLLAMKDLASPPRISSELLRTQTRIARSMQTGERRVTCLTSTSRGEAKQAALGRDVERGYYDQLNVRPTVYCKQLRMRMAHDAKSEVAKTLDACS